MIRRKGVGKNFPDIHRLILRRNNKMYTYFLQRFGLGRGMYFLSRIRCFAQFGDSSIFLHLFRHINLRTEYFQSRNFRLIKLPNVRFGYRRNSGMMSFSIYLYHFDVFFLTGLYGKYFPICDYTNRYILILFSLYSSRNNPFVCNVLKYKRCFHCFLNPSS